MHAWADEPHLYLNKKFLKGFEHLAKLAECPNVMTKVSALFMPVLGHHFHQQRQLASKAQLIELATPLIQHALKCFGTDRAMFASNFPIFRWIGSVQIWSISLMLLVISCMAMMKML